MANALKDRPGALTLILRRVQDELGWVPPDNIPIIAHILNLSRAEVHGVVSFYHDFRHEPPGATSSKYAVPSHVRRWAGGARGLYQATP